MIIENPYNISLKKLNTGLNNFSKSKIYTSFSKRDFIICKFKGTRQLIGKNEFDQIFIKTQIPAWWNFFSLMFTISLYSVFFIFLNKNIEANFFLSIIFLFIFWLFSIYSFLIFFHKTIKNFHNKLENILI